MYHRVMYKGGHCALERYVLWVIMYQRATLCISVMYKGEEGVSLCIKGVMYLGVMMYKRVND